MNPDLIKELTAYLTDFISEQRQQRIEEILAKRTNHVSVVLEDLHKAHNANAVLRSCDGFGVQDVHIIENKNEFDEAGTVSIGAHQWLSLHRYNKPEHDNLSDCFAQLRKDGYQIIATTPHEKDSNINELPINEKVALVFGTELVGVSDQVKEQADGFVKIPMYGFSESFNISVSAAVCLYELTTRLRASDISWNLDETYKDQLRYDWIKQTIKAGDQIVEKYLKERGGEEL